MLPEGRFPEFRQVNVLLRQQNLDEFCGNAEGTNHAHCAPEVQPGSPQMITGTDYPDALKEDTPYEFAL
ncbi:MAG: hypothetical protein ABSF34_10030 [Verrucomicrobiota bacterium]|jgi:hypothetical protein